MQYNNKNIQTQKIMKRILLLFSLFALISCVNNSNYKILKEETSMNVCRLQVQINGKLTKPELKKIAIELRKTRKDFDKLWISFYQPDLLPDKSGNGAWAVASFTPDLEVSILGENKPSNTKNKIAFPNYSTVIGMLEASGDFKDHCLQKLSKDGEPLHIRVSNEFLKGESISNMKEQTKRDIIYVAFQAFAETNIEKITVTSIPIIRSSFNPNLAYDGKLQESLKQAMTITRTKAKKILKKYLHTSSFKDLYQLNGTLYVPNAKFDRLQFGELKNVYSDLKK